MGVTRVRGADGARWTIRTRALVWPRWRELRLTTLDALDFVNFADILVVDSVAGFVLSIVAAVALFLVGTAVIFVLLPGIVFFLELLALPFVALFFRGRRVVEARNEATGERIRVPVRGRAEAHAKTRELERLLGTVRDPAVGSLGLPAI